MGIKLGKFFKSITTIKPQTMQTLDGLAALALPNMKPEQQAEVAILLDIARARSQGPLQTINVFEGLTSPLLTNLTIAEKALVSDFFSLLREKAGVK